MIIHGAIDECAEGLHRVGFNGLVNNEQFNLALRFIKWGSTYEFSWGGGEFQVTRATYQMAVVYARKRGVPVFLVDNTYQYAEFE